MENNINELYKKVIEYLLSKKYYTILEVLKQEFSKDEITQLMHSFNISCGDDL